MKSSFLAAALATLSSGLVSAVPLASPQAASTSEKTVLLPQVLPAWENNFKRNSYPMPHIKKNPWVSSIPVACVDAARGDPTKPALCPLDYISVFQVWYEDSGPNRPWTVCHCKNAEYSETQMIQEIGRVLPGMRQFVRYWIGFRTPPETGLKSAETTEYGDVIFKGIGSLMYLHTVGKMMDISPVPPPFSDSQEFADAVAADTCWLTPQAKSEGEKNPPNLQQAWADVAAARRYRLHVGNYPAAIDCAQNQINVVRDHVDWIINGQVNGTYYQWPEGDIAKRSDFTPF